MLLQVIDGAGLLQTVIAHGQETVVDHSGVIAVSNVAQVLLAANPNRSGWFLQNLASGNPMFINETGVAATEVVIAGDGSFQVDSTFPPVGYPVTTTAISIIGSAGDTFVCREW